MTLEASQMDIDLLLAIGHHLAVFLLVAILAAEFALLRPGLGGTRIGQLARIDAAYGGVATLVIVVGVLRVIFGASGWEYYVANYAFWAKMAAFLVMGLLTIQPTIAIRRWLKASKEDAAYVVPPSDVAVSRRYIHLQAGIVVLIPIFAAAMARGYGVA
jgi:putative membrane protein